MKILKWLALSVLFLGAYVLVDMAWCRFVEAWAIRNQETSVWVFEMWVVLGSMGVGAIIFFSCIVGKMLHENGH